MNYYNLKKENGLCTRCGDTAVEGGTMCEECMEKQRIKARRKRQEEHIRLTNPNAKLDEDAKAAFEAKMTYGKWRMIQDMKARGEL